MLRIKYFIIVACILAVAVLSGCSSSPEIDETSHITDEQVMNLQKLSKVWGFTKYTHQAFLSGQRCWDEELLSLIPIVMYAGADDVNGMLYEWFVGLGDDGFDLDWPVMRAAILESWREFPDVYYLAKEIFPDCPAMECNEVPLSTHGYNRL